MAEVMASEKQAGGGWAPTRWLGAGRWQAAVLVVLAIIGLISWSRRPGDFIGYYQVGQAVIADADIYHGTPPGINTWPPFFSLVAVPLAMVGGVSLNLATTVWLLLNYVVLVKTLGLLARMIYGRRLTLRRTAAEGELSITASALFVPLMLTSTYLFNNFEHVQINLLLFGLTLAGIYGLETGKELSGSLALGAAASIKVMPVLFLPYLALRRAWKALLLGIAATGLLSLSPILWFGWGRFWLYVREWRHAVSFGWGVGASNQSVYAMWDRLIGLHVTPFTPGDNFNLKESGLLEVKIAWLVTAAIAGLLALRQFRIAAPNQLRIRALEWSVVFIGAALFGPVAWKHYFVILLLPNVLLFALWREPGIEPRARRIIGWVMFSSAVLQLLTAHDLIGRERSVRLELGSAGTLSMLIMLGGLLWVRGRPELVAPATQSADAEAIRTD